MEHDRKNTNKKHKEFAKLRSIYSRCQISRKMSFSINVIGSNFESIIENYISNNFEGKCSVEGYIKIGSSKLISYSSGTLYKGNQVLFDVIFECEVCFPVEGMLISCVAKNITKAGIRAEIANEVPSPIVAFIAKDHNYNSHYFNSIQENDNITVRVIGQRYELNDKYVAIIGELVKERDTNQPTNKPKLVIEK